ncbi:MAG: protein translocase subunit SecF [Cyanobacteria bacterium J06641_5]
MLQLNVIRQQRLWWTVSALAVITCAIAMTVSTAQLGAPLRLGLDFVGGTRLELERDCAIENNCAAPIAVADVREVLVARELGDSSIQTIGPDKQAIAIRTKTLDVDERGGLQAALTEALGQFDDGRTKIDTVGPTVGRDLLISGMLALLVSFGGIIAYLSFRFQIDYAVLAILALFHDAFITAGVFAILGLVVGLEVNSLFLVALLTIIGFSVNDTVVIYDRIRETRKDREREPIAEIVADAVNQSLTRSINTSITTLLPLVAIALFGGQTLKSFALALIIGFALGTYSSIFLASTLLAWWRSRTENLEDLPPEESQVLEAADQTPDPTPQTPTQTPPSGTPVELEDLLDSNPEASSADN